MQLSQKGVVSFVRERDIFNVNSGWDVYIFEGAQGIQLDVNHGIQPYVTKSNTTSKNAIEMLRQNFNSSDITIEIYYVTRIYHTRHGAGPFNVHEPRLQLVNNSHETNVYNDFQGEFKVDYLDINRVNKSLLIDNFYSCDLKKNMVITCLDHIPFDTIPVIHNDKIIKATLHDLINYFPSDINKVFFSNNPYSELSMLK